MTKTGIVERLGEGAVLLPGLIAEALAANDRLKLRLSLLQEAAAQAGRPERRPRDFAAELRPAPPEPAVQPHPVLAGRDLEREHLPHGRLLADPAAAGEGPYGQGPLRDLIGRKAASCVSARSRATSGSRFSSAA